VEGSDSTHSSTKKTRPRKTMDINYIQYSPLSY
jgi:hypothetical protein